MTFLVTAGLWIAGPPRTRGAESMRHEQQRIWPQEAELADAQALYSAWFESRSSVHSKSVVILGLTNTCHQCQGQCLFKLCQCQEANCHGHKDTPAPCEQVVCRTCVAKQYDPEEFQRLASGSYVCPPCRGVCTCAAHFGVISNRALLILVWGFSRWLCSFADRGRVCQSQLSHTALQLAMLQAHGHAHCIHRFP